MLLIGIILFIGIVIGISYLINYLIRKIGINKRYRILSILPILIVGYFIYEAIYPNSDFYKTDFKEVTQMEFPKSGKIIYKTASFPDNFGDYTSSFLVELNNDNILKLQEKLLKNGFKKKENKMISKELEYIENRTKDKEYIDVYVKDNENDKLYTVGFLKDKKSVIITRVSW